MSDTQQTSNQFHLQSGLHLLPQGDDEIFVRAGSRAAFSKVIRDEQGRHLLTHVVQSSIKPTDVESLAARLNTSNDDVQAIVNRLLDEGVFVRPMQQRELHVLLISDGRIGSALYTTLEAMNATVVSRLNASSDLEEIEAAMPDVGLVVVSTDMLRPCLNNDVNTLSYEIGVPVLYVYADGPDVQVGPLVYPGETACYACFEVQDEGARHLRDEFLVFKDDLARTGFSSDTAPHIAAMAAAWAALCVADVQAHEVSRLAERVVRIETQRFEVASHRVLQMPRCPQCSRHRPDLQHTFL